MTAQSQTVGIIGAGLIGRSWANVFARAGWSVVLWDPNADVRATASAQIALGLHELEAHGLVADALAASHRVRIAETLEEAVADVDFVQESGPETPEAKRKIFAQLDAATRPDVVLASSTSAIVASQFTETLVGR